MNTSLRAVIVEDESHSTLALTEILHNHCHNIKVVGAADCVEEAIGMTLLQRALYPLLFGRFASCVWFGDPRPQRENSCERHILSSYLNNSHKITITPARRDELLEVLGLIASGEALL